MDPFERHFMLQSERMALRYPETCGHQQFLISSAITNFVLALWAENKANFTADGRAVSGAKPPASEMLLFISDEIGKVVLPVQVLTRADEVQIWSYEGGRREYFGGYGVAGDILKAGIDREELRHGGFAFFVSLLISILNQPHLVTREPAGERQHRRKMLRQFGIAAEQSTKIVWNLAALPEVRSVGESQRQGMPLHFRRGHWRRAEGHFQGAQLRSDALGLHAPGVYWQWIKEQWPGHPAFGIRLSVHAPKLDLSSILEAKNALR